MTAFLLNSWCDPSSIIRNGNHEFIQSR